MEEILAIIALLFILLPIIAIVMASSTRSALLKRIEALEKELALLKNNGVAPEASAEIPSPSPGPARRTRPQERTPGAPSGAAVADRSGLPPEEPAIIPVAPEPEAPVHSPAPLPPDIPPSAPMPAPEPARSAATAPPAKAPKPARSNAEWEALLGGRVLNRIGALALIIGIGFFLKYAFDKEWITEGMRTAIGGVLGAGLLVIGARATRKGYEVFSQGLVGAGISVLYLTVFAAFNLYDLGLSQTVAFALMGAVTVLAFQQAFYYNSIAVSILGLIGGFLTPLMLSTGNVDAIGLFTYLAILNGGIIAIALTKPSWRVLEPLAMGSTYIYFFAWLNQYFTPWQGGIAITFLLIFWGLFQGADIYRSIRARKSIDILNVLTGVANAGVLLSGLIYIIDTIYMTGKGSGNLIPLACYIAGAFYLGLVALPHRRERPDNRIEGRNALIGIIALMIAIASHPTISVASYQKSLLFSAAGLGLLFWGVRVRFQALWLPAIVPFFMAFIATLSVLEAPPLLTLGPIPLSPMVVGLMGLAAALTISARLAGTLETGLGDTMRSALEFGWGITLFIVLSMATMHTYQRQVVSAGEATWFMADLGTAEFSRMMTLVLVWLAYAVAMAWMGIRWRRTPVLLCALSALALAAFVMVFQGASYEPVREFTPVLNIRAVTFIALVVATGLLARWLSEERERFKLKLSIRGILQTAAVLFIFELLTVEAADTFERSIRILSDSYAASGRERPYALIDALRSREQLVISGLWLLYSAILMVGGILRRLRSLRVIAFCLFGLTILKIFIYDLSFLDTLYRIFSFIGLGVILLVISFLFQRYRDVIFGTDDDNSSPPGNGGGGIASADPAIRTGATTDEA